MSIFSPQLTLQIRPPLVLHTTLKLSLRPKTHTLPLLKTHRFTPPKALQQPQNENNTETNKPSENNTELSELGQEIKKAMEDRKKDEGFVSGVVEEIGEIEWPKFNKVLATTGVVLGVIAGSSLVLLTVNAGFAELSDVVFAGKGLQDFFR